MVKKTCVTPRSLEVLDGVVWPDLGFAVGTNQGLRLRPKE